MRSIGLSVSTAKIHLAFDSKRVRKLGKSYAAVEWGNIDSVDRLTRQGQACLPAAEC